MSVSVMQTLWTSFIKCLFTYDMFRLTVLQNAATGLYLIVTYDHIVGTV